MFISYHSHSVVQRCNIIMDMRNILVHFFIIATIGYNSAAQQITRNQVQIASKPAPNDYVRLSEIPFENAVRAVATPPRDYVPIHEPQLDNPPPQRPQPVQNQQGYNTYQPQTYSNVVPITLGYSTASQDQQIANTPTSYQYMLTNQSPNEVYSQLYHTSGGNNIYLQQNTGQHQGNNGYLQASNGYLQGNNVYIQGGNDYLQGVNGYPQTNNRYVQGTNGNIQNNHGNLQESNAYFQDNTGYVQSSSGYLQSNNYLQQAYSPNVISGYQPQVSYVPVRNKNFGAALSQRFKSVPVYGNYQSSVNNFKPSVPLGQNNVIALISYQKQINSIPKVSTHRFRTGKSDVLALPSNQNVQYLNNGFASKSMYVPARSPRMTSAEYDPVFSMGNSKYVSGGIEYMYPF